MVSFLLLMLSFSLALETASVPMDVISYVTINDDKGYVFNNKDIYLLNFNERYYENEIIFKDSSIKNLSADRVRAIKNLKLTNVDLYFAKLQGVLLENCFIKNVKFINSDLSFLTFKNCSIENISYKDSLVYGIKKSNF